MRRVRTGRFTAVLIAVPATILALTGVVPSALADSGTSYTWGGSGIQRGDDHSWTDPLNWTPQGVPGDGDSVTIAPPDADHCPAVDNIPTVTLQTFSLSSGDLGNCASITGGAITVTSAFSWISGVISTPTTLATGSSGSLTGSGQSTELTASLAVSGTLTVTGQLELGPAAALVIKPTGTLDTSGALILGVECCADPGRLVNNGTLADGAPNLLLENIEFDQNGTVDSTAGDIMLSVGGSVKMGDGATYTSDGSGVWIISSVATLAGRQTLIGGFHIQLGDNVEYGPGTLAGHGWLGGSGSLDWTNGTIQANLTIGHGVTLEAVPVDGGGLFLGSRYVADPPVTLTDHGKILIYKDITMQDQARLQIAKNGSVTLPIYRTISGDGEIDNAGRLVTYVHNGSTEPTTETAPITLDGVGYVDNGGIVKLDKHAELLLTGSATSSLTDTTVTGLGRLSIAEPTSVGGTVTLASAPLRVETGGVLSGTGTVDGNVSNIAGDVDPGAVNGAGPFGTLTVTGNYSQHTGGKLQNDLSVAGNDKLAVGGSASLAGTLKAHNKKGFTPTLDDSRTLLTAGSTSGSFSCSITSGRGSKVAHWQPTISPTEVNVVWQAGSQTTC